MRRFLVLLLLLALPAPGGSTAGPAGFRLPRKARAALEAVDPARIAAQMKFLSSDLLEGRGTGQRGGELAAAFIEDQFQLLGLKGGAAGGAYQQPVPLVGITTEPGSSLKLAASGGSLPLKYREDYVAWSRTQEKIADLRSDLIFVGYGIEAPEYDWDDYKGADVAGKTLLMLVNDPPSSDPALFGGPALTYYGRWTYKFEEGLRKRAAGVILIHTTPSAGYGFNVVQSSWDKEQPFPALAPGSPALKLEAWITEAKARELFRLAGKDLDKAREAAERRDFRPIPLGVDVDAHLVSGIRPLTTSNVLGLLEGSDPAKRSEAVIFSAHYDHLGVGKPENGDAIYNGAVDNATGVAILLEIARAYREASLRGEGPRRSVLFLATAAEEGGLRGSEYYAAHPTFPPGKIAADLNIDGIQVLGKALTYTFLGGDRTTLEPVIAWAARTYHFTTVPDPKPGQGSYFRSDHFPFARVGIPSVSIKQGDSFEGKDPAWSRRQWEEYNEKRYHRPSDEFDPSWDFTGLARLARIAGAVGWVIAGQDDLPSWKPGDPYLPVRLASWKPAP